MSDQCNVARGCTSQQEKRDKMNYYFIQIKMQCKSMLSELNILHRTALKTPLKTIAAKMCYWGGLFDVNNFS